jgi:hypothetical protein
MLQWLVVGYQSFYHKILKQLQSFQNKNTILNYTIILQPQYYRRNRIFFFDKEEK